MKASTKWLVGFASAIAALLVLAVVLVLVMPGTEDSSLPPANTPQGVVMRYIRAVGGRDFDTAETYLTANASARYPQIKAPYPSSAGSSEPAWKAAIVDSVEKQSSADVTVEISIFRPQSAFSDPVNTYTDSYSLEKIDGTWKITDMTDNMLWYFW